MSKGCHVEDEEFKDAYLRAVEDGDTLSMERLEAFDGLRAKPSFNLGASALWYASVGIPVFPLKPADKVPFTKHGFQDATTNETVIREWWARMPSANIGAPTGLRFDVIDVDGWEGHRAAAEAGIVFPEQIGVVLTPRPGGLHRFIAPTGAGNRAKMMPGIDYRGQGGYVVMPPSFVRTPEYEGHYEWLKPLRLS